MAKLLKAIIVLFFLEKIRSDIEKVRICEIEGLRIFGKRGKNDE